MTTHRKLKKLGYTLITLATLAKAYNDGGEDSERTVIIDGVKTVINPSFQRALVYSIEQMQALIDSILHGYSIGQVTLAEVNGQYLVVDGQQRITTICKYINGYVPAFNGMYFSSLSEEEQNILNETVLPVAILTDARKEEIAEQFKRTNTCGELLTSIEILCAIYDCHFMQEMKQVFGVHFLTKGFGKKYKDYVKGDATRLFFVELALKIYDPNTNDTEKIINFCIENNITVDAVIARFKEVFNWYLKLVSNLTPAQKKLLPINLVVEDLYNKYARIPMSSEKFHYLISETIDSLDEGDSTAKLVDYVFTQDRQYITPRLFPKAIAVRVYKKQNGICPICGKHFEFDEMQADHIHPWALGGKTKESNCQMLCKDCNNKKSISVQQ